MKIKQTLTPILFSVFIFVAALLVNVLMPDVSYAESYADCAGVKTSIINCDASGEDGIENSGLWALLIIALNILAGLVGVVAVGGIVYGAIMYSSAQDNASQVQEAIGIIRNVVIGIVLFMGMYTILQALIPGGIFD
ncbi:MAG: hypothetical protein UY35_C0009G0027 [Candidatus Saccharibacteria bacterium GW2011_GWC2_48_9]|nr:MAG: hypothetical protein UY35_C0009G0027 [Candidatus Saccharibacteria bacterium GW2011_GWC2_48_9]HCH34072.1 hypothetical protein [Candidatus Saccharibacteria bacterium]